MRDILSALWKMLNFSFRSSESSSRSPRSRLYISCSSRPQPVVTSPNSTDSDTDSQSENTTMDGPTPNEYKFIEKTHPDQVLLGLNELRKNSQFCDITISVDTRKFPVHKSVLCAFSPYFRAMFRSRLAESRQNTVTLNDVDAEMVGLIIDYAYTSTITITRANVQALLSAANLLQVLPVKEACCRFLERLMDSSNCLGIHCFAEAHSCRELEDKSKHFALANFFEVCHQEEFLNLPAPKLIELTSNDNLQVAKEETVFQAVAKWYDFSPEQRKSVFPEVLGTVRLPLLSPYFLLDFVATLPVVQESPECVTLLEEAKLYHLLPDRRHENSSVRTRPRTSSDTIEVIVAVGGEDDKVVLRSVECFVPGCNGTSCSWKTLACLPMAVSKHGLVASGKNTLYLAGGEFPDGGSSKALWRYEPVLDRWQEMANMQMPRSELGLAMLDGLLYAVGGWEGSCRMDSVERYDPSTNTWSYIENLHVAVTSAAVIAHDGFLYVTGGAVMEDGDGIASVQKFDPVSGSWSVVQDMNIPRSGAAICSLNSLIYVVGGWHASTENTNLVECYDVKNNRWEFKSPMIEKRYRPGISVMEGKIYVFGGEEGWDKYHDSIECYDPMSDSWTICGEMTSARSWLGCVPLQVRKSICKDRS